MKHLPTIKMILLGMSLCVYIAAAVISIWLSWSEAAVVLFWFIVFLILVLRNIKVYGTKWFHVVIMPLVFLGNTFLTSFLEVLFGEEMHTELVDWYTFTSVTSIYLWKWYRFTWVEFFILFSIFLCAINIYPMLWYRKIP